MTSVPVHVGLKTQILPAGEAAMAAAARCLAQGGLVGFPTETVYGPRRRRDQSRRGRAAL